MNEERAIRDAVKWFRDNGNSFPVVVAVSTPDEVVFTRGYKRPSYAFKWAEKHLATGEFTVGFICMPMERAWNFDGEWVGF